MRDEREFVFTLHHPGHAGQGAQLFRATFRRATHKINSGGRFRPVHAPGHGSRIGHGIGRDRAGVDDDNLRAARLRSFDESEPGPSFAQGLALILIDLATQGYDVESPTLPGKIFWCVQWNLFCLLFGGKGHSLYSPIFPTRQSEVKGK